jgi:Flp pilus assembly protein TadG
MTRSCRSRRPRSDEDGAVAVLVALCALALFVIAALVVDLGLARDTRRQSQNAADASALAAANALYPATSCEQPVGATPPCLTDAVETAKTYAAANFGVTSWTDCPAAPSGFQVAPSSPTCISFDSLTTPTKVWVVIPTRHVRTGLGGAAGISDVPVSASARAVLTPGGGGPCGLCVIGSGTHDLQNGDALVSNASVYFNGSLELNPQGSVISTGGQVNIEGSGPDKGTVTPAPTTGAAHIDDPMASLVLPPDMAGLTLKASPNMCTGGPGIYNNPTAANCVLTPGLYVVIGGTLGGNAGITAPGVTLYFTCKTTSGPVAPRACNAGETTGGTLDLSGNGDFSITAPTVSSNKSIPGVAIVFDRNADQTLRLVGNGALSITGSIYLKSGTVDMRGNGCTASTNINSLIVSDDLTFSGANACLKSNYTVDANFKVPPGDPALDR